MKAIVQRVNNAKVTVENEIVGQIDKGLLVYVGILKGDDESDLEFISRKISTFRMFPDEKGKLNLGLQDSDGKVLLVSNFTVGANCRKGNRLSFDSAATPEEAIRLYSLLVEMLKDNGIKVEIGAFGAHMQIESIVDGPVNVILDSKQ